MSKSFVTLHIVNDIPWSNLNRDDTGTPKRTILGGVERGLLSSQSLKRAARRDYEARILAAFPEEFVSYEGLAGREEVAKAASLRSRYAVDWAVNRAKEICAERGSDLNVKKAATAGDRIAKKLTGGEDTILWLSIEELEAFALVLANGFEDSKDKDVLDEIIKEDRRTGALSIAAFGRMFASAMNKQTDAAVAVSPAISTHASIIETDYFSASDDYGFFKRDKTSRELVRNYEGAGAAHLGTALYTNGIFYRTVTFDLRELHRNWSGMTSENARKHLNQLVESVVRSLPTGKKTSTAPYTSPTLVIAEEQNYREAYSISKPVSPTPEGGFLDPTVQALLTQHELAHTYNDDNYGRVLYSGSESVKFTDTPSSMENLVTGVVDWILEYTPPKYLETPYYDEEPEENEDSLSAETDEESGYEHSADSDNATEAWLEPTDV